MLRTHRLGPLAALAALAGALLLPALPAHAQIQAQILSFDGRTSVDLADLATQNGTPINFDECNGPAQVDWRFTNVDPNRANLSFFSGTGCDDASVRTDTNNTSCVDLEVTVAIEGATQVDVTLGVDRLINCDGMSGIDTIWALALDQPASEVTGTNQSASFPLAYDFVGPSAPTNLTASNGRSGSRLDWTSAGTTILRSEIFLISDGCTNGVANEDLDFSTSTPAQTIDGNVASGTVPFPTEDPFETEYAVAVRAFDQSSNPSELSGVQCVRKVPVTSFFEMYCESGESSADACTGGSCSVSAGRRSTAGLGWLMMFGLAALALRRVR
ncbi:MAG: hypothetical protein AB8I08_34655 [Sandaracinaceae bacterium]